MKSNSVVNFIDRKFHYFCTLPAFIVILIVVAFPTLYGLYTSFFVRNLLRGKIYFTGFDNYIALFHDPIFWGDLYRTVIYTVGSLLIGFTLAFFLALALNSGIRLRVVFIVAILLPWMTPPVSGSIMWKWIIHDVYGLLNYVLLKIGIIDQNVFWLGIPATAMLFLVILDAWYRIPLSTLILFAGMQRIPGELYDAARVDGAGRWQTVWHVTIPFIRHEILIALVIHSMFTFREFGFSYLLTGGGPGDKTQVLALSIYKTANLFLRQGYAAAMSIVMFILITAFVTGYFKAIKTKV
ncbi:ABC transporter permease subunit [candidate division KSB3 bacterium]|uniref:ABC transporter permease subunit n=1 Tax=candidate division KSB3 bacterium TaxID=2044937 RepID=A0A9D5JY66_9BACT|nr:ABC transporter permease subunit [candidate division KSB3 bacterium]MBD3326344.1 ABC transporter permease subunit [candidate division KSB3 bacterium]